MVVESYCRGHVQSLHVRSGYADIKSRYVTDINGLQHRYQEASGRWKGGLVVSDGLAQRPGSVLFR